jgi:hypothetical protein
LRLYDYLASDRPIVSTNVAAAAEHHPHVAVGRNVAELAGLLRAAAVEGISAADRAARRLYIRRQTWAHRANLFLTNLHSVLTHASI